MIFEPGSVSHSKSSDRTLADGFTYRLPATIRSILEESSSFLELTMQSYSRESDELSKFFGILSANTHLLFKLDERMASMPCPSPSGFGWQRFLIVSSSTLCKWITTLSLLE